MQSCCVAVLLSFCVSHDALDAPLQIVLLLLLFETLSDACVRAHYTLVQTAATFLWRRAGTQQQRDSWLSSQRTQHTKPNPTHMTVPQSPDMPLQRQNRTYRAQDVTAIRGSNHSTVRLRRDLKRVVKWLVIHAMTLMSFGPLCFDIAKLL